MKELFIGVGVLFIFYALGVGVSEYFELDTTTFISRDYVLVVSGWWAYMVNTMIIDGFKENRK